MRRLFVLVIASFLIGGLGKGNAEVLPLPREPHCASIGTRGS